MTTQQTNGSELKQSLVAAEEARTKAEKIAADAAKAQAVAEAAHRQAVQRRQAAQRRWAEPIVSSIDADLAAAREAVARARLDFEQRALSVPDLGVELHIAYVRAQARLWVIGQRYIDALRWLDQPLPKQHLSLNSAGPRFSSYADDFAAVLEARELELFGDVEAGLKDEMSRIELGEE